jgi:hypothetical protein
MLSTSNEGAANRTDEHKEGGLMHCYLRRVELEQCEDGGGVFWAYPAQA